MKIITNNHYRPVISGYELTLDEAKDFDYMDDVTEASFFRYRGQVYSLGDFMRIEPHYEMNTWAKGWHGYSGGSFFGGLLIALSDCGDGVRVARWFN